jgi:transposase
MNHNSLIAIDLAKHVFQVCVVDSAHRVVLNRSFNRRTLIEFIRQQTHAVVAMEACYSSHYWGRLFQSYGHQVMLLPAQHVKPFVRGNKNDANDALSIAETARRPGLIPVPVKTRDQQDIQTLHRLRERYVGQRTALGNQLRGLLSEYGIVFNQGYKALRQALIQYSDPASDVLSELIKQQFREVYDELLSIEARLDQINRQLAQIAQHNVCCQRLMSIPGIGLINATALYSAIGNGSPFSEARQLPVWLGITPKHAASGQPKRMGRISKRGDGYLRKQLIHGARALMYRAKYRDDRLGRWIQQILHRRGPNKACVALANRLARLCWIVLQRQEMYRP